MHHFTVLSGGCLDCAQDVIRQEKFVSGEVLETEAISAFGIAGLVGR